MAALHITDIESAINWWRERRPSPDGITACAEVRALAEIYGRMVYQRQLSCDEADLSGLALPTSKQRAIDELTYGTNSKQIVGELKVAIGNVIAEHEALRQKRGRGVAWGDARDLLVGDDPRKS